MFLAALSLGAAGCDAGRSPRVVSAELLDRKSPDGLSRAGETIRITLDRPPPPGIRGDQVRLWSGPPRARLLVRALPQAVSNLLDFELLSTPPPLQAAGLFAMNPEAGGVSTGIGVDLGPAAPGEQWVDLQERRSSPVLLQAIWEDRPPEGATTGDLVVDQGDWIRLIFDREVKVSTEGAGRKETGKPALALVPGDLLLASQEDQLDDGTARSVLMEGAVSREVRIVLGSSPRLTIAGRHRTDGDLGRSMPFRPSGIAVNGTPIQPSSKIVDRRGWPGAVSRGPVDIEFPQNYYFFEKRVEEAFPPPGHRSHHTVTTIAGGRAVIAGGRTWEGKAIGDVLLYNPEAPRQLAVLGEMAEPRYLHTASLLPGEDGLPGTLDDFVVIAGGTDGNQSLASLAAVRLDPSSPDRISVEPVEGNLKWPRMYHTATCIPPAYLLLEGGRYSGHSGEGGIIPFAELLLLDSRGGKVILRKRWELPTHARMRHSATYLGRGAEGAHYILDYGGFGLPPDRGSGDFRQGLLAPDQGMVLASPELVRIEPGPAREAVRASAAEEAGPGEPRVDRIVLEYEFRFEMLRYDHRAVPIGFDPSTVQGQKPRDVFIAGGSLQPLNYDPALPGRNLYEPPSPRRPDDVTIWARGPSPLFTESAAGIIFEFHPAEPARSVFRIVESPTGDRRVHFALAPLAYPGVLILGGENPQRPEEIYPTAEIYLLREKRLAPLAVPFAAARTRLGTLVIDGPEGATVYILGGASAKGDAANFADIERLKLEWR